MGPAWKWMAPGNSLQTEVGVAAGPRLYLSIALEQAYMVGAAEQTGGQPCQELRCQALALPDMQAEVYSYKNGSESGVLMTANL